MKITWNVPEKTTYAEASQSLNIKFAWLYKDPENKGTFISQTGLMKCKDFFNEIWLKEKFPHLEVPTIYRFEVKNLQHHLKNNNFVYLLLDFKLAGSQEIFKAWLPKLNEFETDKGFKPTTLARYSTKEKRLVVRLDRKYFYNTVVFSMITWCLRVMCYPEGDVTQLPWEWIKNSLTGANKDYNLIINTDPFPIIDKLAEVNQDTVLKCFGPNVSYEYITKHHQGTWHDFVGFYSLYKRVVVDNEFTRLMQEHQKSLEPTQKKAA